MGAVAILALAGAAALFPWPGAPAPQAPAQADAARARMPTLYCEFNNFADRTPLVGFYFRRTGDHPSPSYALIYRREQDGSQRDAGEPDLSAAPWRFEREPDAVTLTSPDDETAINLYGDEAARTGTVWFEAGLRSIRFKNLGGRCRHGA